MSPESSGISSPTVAPAVVPRLVDSINKRITVEVLPYNYRTKTVLTSGLVSGTLTLIRLGNLGYETILGTTEFTAASLNTSGVLKTEFNNVQYKDNLVIDYEIVTSMGTYSSRKTVLPIQ